MLFEELELLEELRMDTVNLVYRLQLDLAFQIFIRDGLAQLLGLLHAVNALTLLQCRLEEVLLLDQRNMKTLFSKRCNNL